MKSASCCWRGLLGASLVLAVGWVGVASGRQSAPAAPGKAVVPGKAPAGSTKAPAPGTKTAPAKGPVPGKAPAAPPAPQVKAFALSNANAEEVVQTLRTLWAPLMAMQGPAGRPVAPPRLSADVRTRTLFVRGTDKELEAAGELIGMLDAGPGSSPRESKGLEFVRLNHAKIPEVTKVLTELGLQGRIIPVPRINTLILPRDGDEAKEAREIIKKLDVENKPIGGKKPDPKVVKKPVTPAR